MLEYEFRARDRPQNTASDTGTKDTKVSCLRYMISEQMLWDSKLNERASILSG